jgi:hypothetical protein
MLKGYCKKTGFTESKLKSVICFGWNCCGYNIPAEKKRSIINFINNPFGV